MSVIPQLPKIPSLESLYETTDEYHAKLQKLRASDDLSAVEKIAQVVALGKEYRSVGNTIINQASKFMKEARNNPNFKSMEDIRSKSNSVEMNLISHRENKPAVGLNQSSGRHQSLSTLGQPSEFAKPVVPRANMTIED